MPTRSTGPVTPEVLRNAVRSGDRKQVKSILHEEPELIKSKGRQDRATLLHGAASLGDAALVTYLLENGAEVDARDRWGRTPLAWAAGFGRMNTVELLLAHEAAIDLADDWGVTALHWAAFCGHADLVQMLIERGANAHAKDNRGFNVLYCAAAGGQVDVAKLLLSRSLDVNTKSNEGWTALHSAAFRGHLEMVEWLLANGAEVNATNLQGQTPLFWAAVGSVESTGEMPWMAAARETAKDETGNEDLSRHGNKSGTVKCLLARGADANASDECGKTPLHGAVHVNDPDVTRLLLDAGARVDAKDNEGWTALCVAAKHGFAGLVKLLLDRGADPHVKLVKTYTPFNYAVLEGHRDAAELLLAAEPQTKLVGGPRCPGCGTRQQILMTAPFVSDQQERRILRCTTCGAIWSKRKIACRASIQGAIALFAAAFYAFEVFREHHGIVILRIALVVLWTLMGIESFTKKSEQARIWVRGTSQSA